MKKTIGTFFAVMHMIFIPPAAADVNSRSYDYGYDFWHFTSEAVPAFVLERVIDRNTFPDIHIGGFDDVRYGGGKLFLVDSSESRIHILDDNLDVLVSLRLLYLEDGRIAMDDQRRQVVLSNPEGVFFHSGSNQIFVADTGARRVLVLDGDRFFLKRIMERPDGMTGVTEFRPSKIAVDNTNRIYIVVQSGYEGIIELNENGSFSRYYGYITPTVNLVDHFWRLFATNEQRERMARVFAPAFNNIDIDQDGFIYATTFDANSRDMVFRLNPRGENVLIEDSNTPVIGDLNPRIDNQFTAVAVNDYGVYAVLDRSQRRIFIYNFYGEMISIINYPPEVKGSFTSPSGIAWFGDRLVAADRQLRRAYVYSMTDFGRLAMGSARHFHQGEWEESARLLEKALSLNSNFDLAYSGIGKHYLMQGDYENAMYFLRLGQNRTFYSRAFNRFRNEWVKDNFYWFVLVFIVLVVILIRSEIQYHKKGEEKNEAGA